MSSESLFHTASLLLAREKESSDLPFFTESDSDVTVPVPPCLAFQKVKVNMSPLNFFCILLA